MKSAGIVFDTLAGAGLVVALALAPTQFGFAVRGANVSPSDLLLLPVAGCWLLGCGLSGRWRRLVPRPGNRGVFAPHPVWRFWPHALLVLAALISARVAANRADAVKEGVQLTLYFLVAPLLFFDFIVSRRTGDPRRRLAVLLAALLAPVLFNLAAAAVQYVRPDVGEGAVRGLFLNRNVLGGWMALTAPILFGLAAGSGGRALWAVAIPALLAVMTVTLAGAAYGAIALAVLLLAARRNAALFLITALCLTLWQTCVLPRLPRENDLVHFRSVALYDENGTPERRYPEWQAAASLILTRPLTGVGAGNYQREIGRYYDVVPNATGPAEPDIQNLYLVVAASMGLPALFALIAIFGRALSAAAGSAVSEGPAWRTGLGDGLAAGIGAFALTAVWHPLLVRGIGIPLAAALALAHALACGGNRRDPDRASQPAALS